MSFAAARQLVTPQAAQTPAGTLAPLPWESDEEESLARQDTWLLSFIDILALLLTLFVLLLAYQDQGADDLPEPPAVQLELSMLVPGQGDGGLMIPSNAGPGLLPMDAGGYALPAVEQENSAAIEQTGPVEKSELTDAVTESPAAADPVVEAVPAETQPDSTAEVDPIETVPTDAFAETEFMAPPLPTAEDRVQQAVANSNLGQGVELVSEQGVISLEIRDNIVFKPASAALSVEGELLLNEVALVLAELPYNLSVEGHTDNVPINSSRYPSNWELSSARAAMATRALIEFGVSADRLRAVGYGDTRPRAENTTAEGRARNRRVSFVLEVDRQAP